MSHLRCQSRECYNKSRGDYVLPMKTHGHVRGFCMATVVAVLGVASPSAASFNPTPRAPTSIGIASGIEESTQTPLSRGNGTNTSSTSATESHWAYGDALAPQTWSNWTLALFALVASVIALRTLRAIRRQAEIESQALVATQEATEVTRISADAARSQAETSEKMLVLTQRPSLIIRNVVIESPQPMVQNAHLFQHGHSVVGQFHVENVGGTRAEITDCGCWVFWDQQPKLPMNRPYEGLSGNNSLRGTLEPGSSVSSKFRSETPMGPEGTSVSQGSSWSLYVMGWVEYKDGLGVTRRATFCRRYEAFSRRFQSIDDADYEHGD